MASIAIQTRKFSDLPQLTTRPDSGLMLVHDGSGVKTIDISEIGGGGGLPEDPLGVTHGGTGVTSYVNLRNKLGLGNTTGALPIANGGTGGTTASAARTNLGLANIVTYAESAKKVLTTNASTITTFTINPHEGITQQTGCWYMLTDSMFIGGCQFYYQCPSSKPTGTFDIIDKTFSTSISSFPSNAPLWFPAYAIESNAKTVGFNIASPSTETHHIKVIFEYHNLAGFSNWIRGFWFFPNLTHVVNF